LWKYINPAVKNDFSSAPKGLYEDVVNLVMQLKLVQDISSKRLNE